jgi:hypothetical protein
LTVLQEIPLRTSAPRRCTVVRFLPNLLADSAIFVLEEGDTPLANSGTPR